MTTRSFLLFSHCAKLVINSHVKYHRALIYALRSLYTLGFDEWEDVVVVLGGCDGEDEHEPWHQIMPLSAEVMIECTVIRTSQDNYDFHGYNMPAVLYLFRFHSESSLLIYFLLHSWQLLVNPTLFGSA